MSSDKGSSKAIGIDLGTTYSCVSVYQHGKCEVITNADGDRTTPSAIFFASSKERMVGASALAQCNQAPQSGAALSKRFIGRGFDEPEVIKARSSCGFSLVKWDNVFRCESKNNTPEPNITDNIRYKINRGGEEIYIDPIEVSTQILMYLKQCAQNYLGHDVESAVHNSPSTF
ncbi:hypothetical protein EDEG_00132 [Edhazardia aedis USNM 41457]|uniref:Hsp70-like protein n=1 Tax=Edhazardia aedis (strain USNM 41457) TaxID=1003232 RepID=J9DA92_EDHAE|nr:hypothetical protein EDEG_00132 [Edhazardia aedis USNM 41457]|eukprot:EJW04429.1 hypothetical protein EDEG_00132 [Edhazardia aedis USNM 41457]